MRKRALTMAALAACCALAATAQSHPDFSGYWRTNPQKSDFGPMRANNLMWTIEHQDPQLKYIIKYSSDTGDKTVETHYLTDGRETVSKPGAVEIRSVARWEGSELAIESRFDSPEGKVTVQERWSLSEDRNTLTMDRTMSGPNMNYKQKLVYDRE